MARGVCDSGNTRWGSGACAANDTTGEYGSATAWHTTTSDRPVYFEEFLPRSAVLDRPALHQMQYSASIDRHVDGATLRAMGRLQAEPRCGQNRKPVRIQDRRRTLQRTACSG